ncbi:MAG: GWxTD domain-containing protein [Bacteroidia bacterium]
MRNVLFLIFSVFTANTFAADLYLDAVQFLDQNQQPYIEVQYKIPSESLQFAKNENDKWQGAVKINIEVIQAKESLLTEEYNLFSQELDTLDIRFDLIDFKKVFVGNGLIEIKVTAMDYLNGLVTERKKSFLFKRPYLVSDISLLHNFYFLEKTNAKAHGNIFTVPRVSTFFAEHIDTFIVYFETYAKPGKYNLSVYDQNNLLNYLVEVEHTAGKLKQHIVKLPKLKIGSGKLVVKIESSNGEALKSIEIIVPKPIDKDRFLALTTYELKRYFRWIEPIAGMSEFENLNTLLNDDDSSQVKIAFMEFWEKRNAVFAWKEWLLYQNNVALVNKEYGLPGKPGFMTDRGRVYLQYGPPGNVTDMHNNPQTYPYETWQYYDDGKMGDSRFYFVNYSFTRNNYVLVHSTALGEAQNPTWRDTLDRGNKRGHNKNGVGSGWQNEFINE